MPAGVALATQTCQRRLTGHGVRARPAGAGRVEVPDRDVACEITPFGPAPCPPAAPCDAEPLAQALSGLMAVNGRDEHRPARIGIELGSVAAGILATQAGLATAIGAARGCPTRTARTSVLQAALLACSHYIARATGDEDPTPAGREPEPGPPFPTRDGWRIEIETLDPQVWRAFWRRLGAPDEVLGMAWTQFRPRYFAGTCTLPPGLHAATERHSLAELTAVADSFGVTLCPLRGHDAVLADLDGWRGTPDVAPLPGDRPGARTPKPATGASPLAGLHVVETTNRMQGPLAGLLLRMLGATVTKVEPPGGDPGRGVPPMAGEVGSFFRCFNRGKHPVELDLREPSGRGELVELLAGADVFLHNWPPGRDRAWSLTPADLAAHNPALVYARASGWGARPELDHLLGMDFPVQAYAGLATALTPAGEAPRTSRLTLTDFMGALVTAEGILAALLARLADGAGRQVDASLLAGGMTLQAHVLDGLVDGRSAGQPVWGLLDRPIETAEGSLVVSADDELAKLADACGLDSGPDVAQRVAGRIAAGTAAGWQARLDDAGLPCAVVRTDLAALPGDPALRGLFEPLGAGCYTAACPWEVG